jgi:hypothetical protein
MIRHAGLLTKREERGLIASVTQSVVKENRPDISILNPIISAGSSRDLIDIAITGAMGGSEHGVIQPPNNRSVATEQGRQAHQQARFELNKYGELCRQRNYSFTPFIIQSTGLLHKIAIDFLKMLPQVGVFNYYLRCLSCVLQKSNGNSINKRYLNLITGL